MKHRNLKFVKQLKGKGKLIHATCEVLHIPRMARNDFLKTKLNPANET